MGSLTDNVRNEPANNKTIRDHCPCDIAVLKPMLPIISIHRLPFYCIGLVIIFSSGCQSLGVESWERGTLSQPAMQFTTRDLDLAMDDHFYFSKEGISGGRGFSGGGCGCN